MGDSNSRLFPALLKYWRGLRGLSQLDLALAAEVSSRHLSFLETGRAQPSQEMVLLLANTLQVPLRNQNELLMAAGFDAVYPEPSMDDVLNSSAGPILQCMLDKHEPFPMAVMNSTFDLLLANQSATHFLMQFIADPNAIGDTLNMFEVLYDPNLARPFIQDWQTTARTMLSRLQREVLLQPHNEKLSNLLEKILSFPDIPSSWKKPDFSQTNDVTLNVRVKRDHLEFTFVTTMTRFSVPHNITLEELLIESYFPANKETETLMTEFFSQQQQ